MKHLKSAAVMLIVLAPFVLMPTGEAATYEWTDDAGVVHFTDDQGKIPAKFQKRVKELNISDETVNPPPAAAPESPPPAVSLPEKGAARYGGFGEAHWRSKFAPLRKEIKSLEESLPAMKDDLDKLRRKRVVYGRTSDRVAVENAVQAIARNEERLKALQESLKNLDNEASLAGVPAEWRQ